MNKEMHYLLGEIIHVDDSSKCKLSQSSHEMNQVHAMYVQL